MYTYIQIYIYIYIYTDRYIYIYIQICIYIYIYCDIDTITYPKILIIEGPTLLRSLKTPEMMVLELETPTHSDFLQAPGGAPAGAP